LGQAQSIDIYVRRCDALFFRGLEKRIMLLSVIVPCFNEEAVLLETHKRLTSVLDGLQPLTYDLIYVDDGSRDGTIEILRALQLSDARVRVMRLSRNFGHQIAVTAGLAESDGDAVVIIDADLQDPPEVIPEMMARWRDGYDVVYGLRTDRHGETPFKLWTAKTFYQLLNRVSRVRIPPWVISV
jgi:dolichol-phosphate mannosyltransferase